ncbi:MAG: hypothetical protein QNJ98_11000 [Planctomycetota bacterium]|nr:hypothetical protein [Planctomycetota bacterium]
MAATTGFESGIHAIDARLHAAEGTARGGIVVAHPHPLHGGNMDHPVVVAACERAARLGLTALRFDFRGVRASEGSTSDFLGHLDDWRAAVATLRAHVPEGPLLGAGFSYGARSLAALLRPDRLRKLDVRGALLIAPATRVPRSKRDFGNLLLGRPLNEATLDAEALDNLRAVPVPTRVIVGSGDVVAPHDELRRHLAADGELIVLEGLGHFFSRRPGAGPVDHGQLDPALDQAIADLLDAAG